MYPKYLIIICSIILISSPSLACWPDSEDIVYPSEEMMNKAPTNIIAVKGIIKKNTTPYSVIKHITHDRFNLEVEITKNFYGTSLVGDTVMVEYGPCSSLKGEMKVGDEINIIAKNTDEKSLSVINYYQYSKASSQLKD